MKKKENMDIQRDRREWEEGRRERKHTTTIYRESSIHLIREISVGHNSRPKNKQKKQTNQKPKKEKKKGIKIRKKVSKSQLPKRYLENYIPTASILE